MSRITEKINQNWEFYLNDNKKTEIVCLPHSVKLTPVNSSGGRNYQGLCTYEKTLIFDKKYSDKKVFIEFEGAMGVTQFFVNNKLVKTHYCGYTPLIADITEYVRFGQENLLLLNLDNSDNEEVPPGKPQKELDFSYDGAFLLRGKNEV